CRRSDDRLGTARQSGRSASRTPRARTAFQPPPCPRKHLRRALRPEAELVIQHPLGWPKDHITSTKNTAGIKTKIPTPIGIKILLSLRPARKARTNSMKS